MNLEFYQFQLANHYIYKREYDAIHEKIVSLLVYERLFYYCCYSLLDHNSGHNCIIMTGIMIHTFPIIFSIKMW